MRNDSSAKKRALLLLLVVAAALFLLSRFIRRDSGERFHAHFFEPFSYAPSGKSLLLRSRFEDRFELAVRDLQSGEQKIVHQAPRPQLAIAWSPDSQRIVFQQKAKGNIFELYLLMVSTGELRKLEVPPSYSARQPLLWAPDASAIIYTAAGQLQNPAPLSAILLIDGAGVAPPWILKENVKADALYAWSPDSRQLLLMPDLDKAELLRIDRDGAVLQQYELPPLDTASQISWQSPEEALLLFRPAGEKFIQLFSLMLSDGRAQLLAKEQADIEKPLFGSSHATLYYHRAYRGVTELIELDSATRKTRAVVAATQGSFQAHHFDAEKRLFRGILENYSDPRQALIFDSTGKLAGRDYQVAEDLNLTSSAPAMIELGSGQESFPALLWEPAPESRANRAIIVVHGGPFGQEYPFWNAARAALLAEGWTVLALNYHGSSGNGAVPVVEKESRESVRRGMEQQIRDVCIGAQFIRSRFSGKIQLYLEGESYGTHLVLAALTQLDPLPDGIVLKATLPRTLPPVPAERAPLRIAAFHGEEDWLASPQSAFSYLDHIFSKRPMLKMSFAEEGHVLRRQSSWQKLHQLAYDRAEPE